LEGAIRYALGQLGETASILLNAAQRLANLDLRLARETLLEALQAALYAGRLAVGVDARTVARAAQEVPREPDSEPTVTDLLLDGYTTLLIHGYGAAVPLLREALATMVLSEFALDDGLRWLMFGCLAAGELWDDDAMHTLVNRWVDLARTHGALASLPVALNYQAWYEVQAGAFVTAQVCCTEEDEISRATQNPGVVGSPGAGRLLWQVWTGQETEARATAAALISESITRGQGAGITHAHAAIAVLELGLAHYRDGTVCALDVYQEDLTYLGTLTLADLVEAAIRSDEPLHAQRAIDRLSERALASGTPWALGLLARSRALIADDAGAEGLYEEAISHLQKTRIATDLARTHLLYGEWLRRQRRRLEARTHLRTAHEMFEDMGAEAFADRTRTELVATGERSRKRTAETRSTLTSQEAHIAALTAEGLTNREIAARLFISASTVEYHLRKVFQKLGVVSRTQLARNLLKDSATLTSP
jgi:DNA-binding CsgD family transcriptional regulator